MTFNLEPCKSDELGRNVKDYRVRDFYEKIAEELFEAHEQAVDFYEADEVLELIHVMIVCASRIQALGFSDKYLAEFQNEVIERNRNRGYFEEVPDENHA